MSNGNDIKYLKIDPNGYKDAATLVELKVKVEHIEDNYINKDEFAPIKMLVYGLVGSALMALIGAIIKLLVLGG